MIFPPAVDVGHDGNKSKLVIVSFLLEDFSIVFRLVD